VFFDNVVYPDIRAWWVWGVQGLFVWRKRQWKKGEEKTL